MDFLLSKKSNNPSSKQIKLGNYTLQYFPNHQFGTRDLIYENPEILLIGEVNAAFKNSLTKELTSQNIDKHIHLLNNGYVICVERQCNSITIYTDIFGFYHIFYLMLENECIFSSQFKDLLKISNKRPNHKALLDIILFNYTLFDRTIIDDIKRPIGGSVIKLKNDEIRFEIKHNFALNFQFSHNKEKISHIKLANVIAEVFKSNIYPEIPTTLSMTGGFDSRALLAASHQVNIPVKSLTFGQKGNIEAETIKPFIDNYVVNHKFVQLDLDYIANINNTFSAYIDKNLDNPVFHSLVEYEHCSNELLNHNFIAGFMGGELINGQSVGAQVMITFYASRLLTCSSFHELEQITFNTLEKTELYNSDYFKPLITSYLKELREYMPQKGNKNILTFLFNEEYSKLFGAVNKVLKNKCNLVVPFMDTAFLNTLLNSEISFLHKKTFKSNPLLNIKSKILYAKSIKQLCPSLKDTRFDRLYRLKDICSPILLFIAATFYFFNHIFKLNKKKFNRTTCYHIWYSDIVKSSFNHQNINKNMKGTVKDGIEPGKTFYQNELKLTAFLFAINKIDYIK